MSEDSLDVFFDTFESNLESALSCLENENLFNEKIKVLEKNLLDASPNLIAEIQIESLDNSQVEKIRGILKLLKTLELKTNAKLNWFQDLDQHLKQSLAKEI